MYCDRKTNEKQLTELTAQLKVYNGSTATILFEQLFEQRIVKYRIMNDTAPEQEFFRNQGAIQELLALLKLCKLKEHNE